MTGSFAKCAEITGRGDQTLAKVMLPGSVYQHPCCEWIVSTSNGLGELEPAAAMLKACTITPERGQKTAGNLGSRCISIAAIQNGHFGRPGCIGQGVNDWILRRSRFF